MKRILLTLIFVLTFVGQSDARRRWVPQIAVPPSGPIVAHGIAVSSDGVSATTSGQNTSGANLIVLLVSFLSGETVTVTDSSGSNTWTPLTTYNNVPASRIYYCYSPTTSGSQTFTVSGGASTVYPSISFFALSGMTLAGFDVENGAANAASNTISTGSVTPSQSNVIILTGLSNGQSFSSIDSGFTIGDAADGIGFGSFGMATAYKIGPIGGAENPQWTTTGAAYLATSIAAFKF